MRNLPKVSVSRNKCRINKVIILLFLKYLLLNRKPNRLKKKCIFSEPFSINQVDMVSNPDSTEMDGQVVYTVEEEPLEFKHHRWESSERDVELSRYEVYEQEAADLEHDIAVNQMMADQNAPIDQDAELVDIADLSANEPVEYEFMGEHRRYKSAERFEKLFDAREIEK